MHLNAYLIAVKTVFHNFLTASLFLFQSENIYPYKIKNKSSTATASPAIQFLPSFHYGIFEDPPYTGQSLHASDI